MLIILFDQNHILPIVPTIILIINFQFIIFKYIYINII